MQQGPRRASVGSFGSPLHGDTGAMLLHRLWSAIQAHQRLIHLVAILCTARTENTQKQDPQA